MSITIPEWILLTAALIVAWALGAALGIGLFSVLLWVIKDEARIAVFTWGIGVATGWIIGRRSPPTQRGSE